MLDTKRTYTADGTANTFTIPFPYLDREHIVVSVNGVQATNIVFLSDSQVQIAPTPSAGQKVRIARYTPYNTPVAEFRDGGVTRAQDLNANSTQSLYVIQEIRDRLALVEGTEISSPTGGDVELPEPDEAYVLPVYTGELWAYFNSAQFKSAFGLNNDYIRAEQQTNYNVSLGNYPTGQVWVKRPLTVVADDHGDLSEILDGNLSVPAGTYRVRVTCYWNIEAHIAVRLKNSAGTVILGPSATYSDRSTSNAVILNGTITLNSPNTLTVETAASGYDNAPGAQGIAHGVSSFGPNRFTVVELWKVS